jgi:hypothetical protein
MRKSLMFRAYWQVRDKALTGLLAILCLILAVTICCPNARSQTASATSACIQNPTDYKTAFESCQPIDCVSSNLYGVIAQGTTPVTVYPANFKWAWVSGYENLFTYSGWQAQACQGKIPESEVTHRILLYVGFGEPDIAKDTPYTLSVMDLSKDPSLFVPTWQAWFQAFQDTFDLQIPLATQKALTLGLGDQPFRIPGFPFRPQVPIDPTRSFANITGCSKTAAARCDDQPLTACRADYETAAEALMGSSPIKGTGSTEMCVSAFKGYLAGEGNPADVAQTRAMLRYCQDVNPCNTGVGLGFNPAWGMAYGKILTHFTGREFVLLNQPLKDLGAASIGLTPIP